MDCIVTMWTSCEAVVEERWTVRMSDGVICALKSGERAPIDLLDAEDVEVVSVENVRVHSEGTRLVKRVYVEETEVARATDDK